MNSLWIDLRSGLHALLQNKLVSGLAILSLALAIAGNTTVFSMISAMFLRPLPFEEPEQLVFLSDRDPDNSLGIHLESTPNFLDLRDRATSFEGLVAFTGASLGLERDAEPEPVSVMMVSAGFLDILRWRPLHGRAPTAEEEAPGGPPVVLLTHSFWRSRFGSDPDLIGGDLNLSGERHRVVGVLPPNTEFLSPTLQMFVPLRLDRAAPGTRERGGLSVFGRLAQGVTLEQADREVEALAGVLAQEHPDDNHDYSLRVITVRDRLVAPPNRRLMAVMQAGLFFVLLIACANVANLLLAQGQGRGRELALRAALGARRRRIVRQLLVESLALALLSLGAGVALGAGAIRALQATLAAQLPPSFQPQLEPRVVLFTVAIACMSGIIFGLLPAWRASRPDLTGALREGGRGGAGSRRWLAKSLVVAQLSLAMALLAGSSIMIQSFRWLQFSSPGFDSEGLQTVALQPPVSRHPEQADVVRFYEQARERIAAVTGVEAVSFVSTLPRSPFNPTRRYTIDGEAVAADEDEREVIWIQTMPGYFRTLGVALLRGRDFGLQDQVDSPAVVIVNQRFAARHWPDRDPVGERIVFDGTARTVVGVVADIWQELLAGEGDGRGPIVFAPLSQSPARAMNLVVRSTGEAPALAAAIRAAIWDVDPRLSVATVITFEEYVGQFFGTQALGVMLRLFGGLALLLAAVGIYGVIAFSVSQRTREIGLRMALGADRGRIVRMVSREGVRLLLLGIAFGLPAVFLVGQAVRSALNGLVPIQPAVAAPMILVLVVVALAASYLPARRAASLEPVKALRID